MRPTVAIVLLLLALCVPAPALAGTFTVPFGAGAPMLSNGWTPRPDAGSVCGYEGAGTVFLNAGTLAAHSGCLYLFNAPGQAQILAVNTTFGFAKASPATGLCAYSFAAQPGDTLRRCSGGTYANAVATSGANWVELGLYNEGGTPVAISTPRANNVVFSSGWVTPRHRDSRPPGRRACSRACRRRSSGRRPTPRAAPRPSHTRSTVVLRWDCEARRARGSAAPVQAAAPRSTSLRSATGRTH
jgi:hypothetical protein